MATFFGLCDSAGNPTGAASDNDGGTTVSVWNNIAVKTFQCPGTGTQVVKEISADIKLISGSSNMRCAIFSNDSGTLIAQGNSAVAVAGAADSWQGHLTQASITPNPATLTGGTNYVLVVSVSAGPGTVGTDHADSTANSFKFDNVDRSGGYGATLPAGTAGNPIWPVRVSVEQLGIPLAWTTA